MRQTIWSVGSRVSGTPYRVRSLLGSGGMGSVYEVEHIELGRVLVAKALHPHLLGRKELVARMRNEWRALAQLNHPNIVRVTDAGETADGIPFFVMERLQGKTFYEILRSKRLPSRYDICRAMAGVLEGLQAAHEMGAVHRDIKPQNLFLGDDGTAYILDFGIAQLRERHAKVITQHGMTVGTPRFMAPEQAAGKPVDGRADIYAAGLVIYELFVGRDPFYDIRDPHKILLAQLHRDAPRIDDIVYDCPPEFADVIARWLAKQPDSRPQSAAIAAAELRSVMHLFEPSEAEREAGLVTGMFSYDAPTLAPERASAFAFHPPSSASWGALQPRDELAGDDGPKVSLQDESKEEVVELASPQPGRLGSGDASALIEPESESRPLTLGTESWLRRPPGDKQASEAFQNGESFASSAARSHIDVPEEDSPLVGSVPAMSVAARASSSWVGLLAGGGERLRGLAQRYVYHFIAGVTLALSCFLFVQGMLTLYQDEKEASASAQRAVLSSLSESILAPTSGLRWLSFAPLSRTPRPIVQLESSSPAEGTFGLGSRQSPHDPKNAGSPDGQRQLTSAGHPATAGLSSPASSSNTTRTQPKTAASPSAAPAKRATSNAGKSSSQANRAQVNAAKRAGGSPPEEASEEGPGSEEVLPAGYIPPDKNPLLLNLPDPGLK